MAWWSRTQGLAEQPKKSVPKGIWTKCERCSQTLYEVDLDANLKVCTSCQHHFRMPTEGRIEMIVDPGTWQEHDRELESADPLGFRVDGKNRSLDYANLFSPTVGFFRGKQSNGSWRTADSAFHPNEWGYEFTEGDPWNYATAAPQDPQGMANLYGGQAALSSKIDSVFAASPDYLVGSYGGTIHEMLEAYDTGMGQYAHSNEPIHNMIYEYNYAGTPWKTQTHVRDVLEKLYNSGAGTGNGYLGDEDNGEMSAWYVFSALGFYPARMGSTDYTIGAPLYPKSTTNLENGKSFTITAPGVSDTNRYIQSATLNGVAYTKNYITHADLLAGGTLNFVMGPNPSTWGSGAGDIPGSITTGSTTPKPLADRAIGGTITVSAENTPNEGKGNLVDDTSLTKWLAFTNTATLTYQFAGTTSVAVKQYTLTSADDVPAAEGPEPSGSAVIPACCSAVRAGKPPYAVSRSCEASPSR